MEENVSMLNVVRIVVAVVKRAWLKGEEQNSKGHMKKQTWEEPVLKTCSG